MKLEQVGNYRIVGALRKQGPVHWFRCQGPDAPAVLHLLPRSQERRELDAQYQRLQPSLALPEAPEFPTLLAVERKVEGSQSAYCAVLQDFDPSASLQQYLDRQERSDPMQALMVARVLARALLELERRQLAHGRIHPGNCFIIGKQLLVQHPLCAWAERAVDAGGAAMVVQHCAPESIRGGEIDLRGDVFSVGAVLYSLLLGHPPFTGSGFASMDTDLLSQMLPDPREERPELSAGMVQLLARCCAPDATARYQRMGDLAEDVESVIAGGLPVHATEAAGGASVRDASPDSQSAVGKISIQDFTQRLLDSAGTGAPAPPSPSTAPAPKRPAAPRVGSGPRPASAPRPVSAPRRSVHPRGERRSRSAGRSPMPLLVVLAVLALAGGVILALVSNESPAPVHASQPSTDEHSSDATGESDEQRRVDRTPTWLRRDAPEDVEEWTPPPPPDPLPALSVDEDLYQGIAFQAYQGDGPLERLPDFDALQPVLDGVRPNVGIPSGFTGDNFALRFQGYLDVPERGNYGFWLNSDDGSRLRIDGQVVIEMDRLQAATSQSGRLWLAPGLHRIEVAYFDQGGVQALNLAIAGIDGRHHDGTIWLKNTVAAGGALAARTAEEAIRASDGRLAWEAEHYHERVPGTSTHATRWWVVSDADCSGDRCLAALPDVDQTAAGTASERIDYHLQIDTPGRYLLGMRAFGAGPKADSCHIGLNGQLLTPDGFGYSLPIRGQWTSGASYETGPLVIEIDEPGAHVLNLWIREDGLRVDRFSLALEGSQEPEAAAEGATTMGERFAGRAVRIAYVTDADPLSDLDSWILAHLRDKGHTVTVGDTRTRIGDGVAGHDLVFISPYADRRGYLFETQRNWRLPVIVSNLHLFHTFGLVGKSAKGRTATKSLQVVQPGHPVARGLQEDVHADDGALTRVAVGIPAGDVQSIVIDPDEGGTAVAVCEAGDRLASGVAPQRLVSFCFVREQSYGATMLRLLDNAIAWAAAGSGGHIVYVSDTPTALDERLMERLQAAGHTVERRAIREQVAQGVDGVDALIIAASADKGPIWHENFKQWTVPMMVCQRDAWYVAGMTTQGRSGLRLADRAEVADGAHPIAQGLPSDIVLSDERVPMVVGEPIEEVRRVIDYPEDKTALVLAAEAGAQLGVGPAPARRVAIFFTNDHDYSAHAYQVFDAAVAWMLQEPGVTP